MNNKVKSYCNLRAKAKKIVENAIELNIELSIIHCDRDVNFCIEN